LGTSLTSRVYDHVNEKVIFYIYIYRVYDHVNEKVIFYIYIYTDTQN